MTSPSKDEFIKATGPAGPPPMHSRIPYAPAPEVFEQFMGRGAILLESVKGPFNIARYSFACFDPYAEYRIKDGQESVTWHHGQSTESSNKPLSTIRDLLSRYKQKPASHLPPFQGGMAGLFCYDFVRYLERVDLNSRDELDIPDAHLFMFDRLIAFDHKEKKAWAIICPGARHTGQIKNPVDWARAYDEGAQALESIISRATAYRQPTSPLPAAPGEDKGKPPEIRHHIDGEQYQRMVLRAKEYIAAGDIFQTNLSLRVSAEVGQTSPWELYLTLREINPSPFAGYLDFGDYFIASSSPERLVSLRSGVIETRPIAGTRPRGASAEDDERMRKELLLNEKERAEHIMLIDLERNDIGRVCDYGSVEVDELMITEDYSHVIHIVSNVKGRLAKGRDMLDAIKATFPGGTITGVPKVRCMEIIDELEESRRNTYTGSFGYLGFSDNMDLNIIIRTYTIKDGRAYVQAGAGIVADSDPEREHRESLKKAEALIRALERAC